MSDEPIEIIDDDGFSFLMLWRVPIHMTFEDIERAAIAQALMGGFKRIDIARRRGISIRALQMKIKKYKLTKLAQANFKTGSKKKAAEAAK